MINTFVYVVTKETLVPLVAVLLDSSQWFEITPLPRGHLRSHGQGREPTASPNLDR